MKPSLDIIIEKMGKGRSPSKRVIAKEIQRLVNDPNEHESIAKVNALLWVLIGRDCEKESKELHKKGGRA